MFLQRLPLLLLWATFAWAQTEAPIPECRSPWLPLQTGNYWVYSTDSRFTTRQHHTLSVLGPYERAGRVYCQLEDRRGNSTISRLIRADEQGRLYEFNSVSAGRIQENLLLDPSQGQQSPYQGPLNVSAAAIQFDGGAALLRIRYVYVLGVGMVSQSETVNAGSSGGFSSGETLLEARIGEKTYRAPLGNDPQLSLAADSTFANCAIPCYYVACGLGSPVDPANTLKPCLRTRLQVSQAPPGASLVLDLFQDQSIYQARFPLSGADWVGFESIPFYTQARIGAPVTLLDRGSYNISLSLEDASGRPISVQWLRKVFNLP